MPAQQVGAFMAPLAGIPRHTGSEAVFQRTPETFILKGLSAKSIKRSGQLE